MFLNDFLSLVLNCKEISPKKGSGKISKRSVSKQNLSCLKKEVIFQKSEKGNSVVLVDKSAYIRHIEGILKDVNKFEVSLKKGILNFSVNHEEHINKQLRSISKNDSLTEQQHKGCGKQSRDFIWLMQST